MPVPSDDLLCRFIRPRDWNSRNTRPKAAAFKQPDLSVWHIGRLLERDVSLEDLRIGHLAGYGQAHHTVGDYETLASEAAQRTGIPFQVAVEWRPEDQYVDEPWRPWAYAHVQVETVEGPANFLSEFRRLLAAYTRYVVPPDYLAPPPPLTGVGNG